MPMYELSEHEIKVIEERRANSMRQSGYARAVSDIRQMIKAIKPTCNTEHQAYMTITDAMSRLKYPTHMRLDARDEGRIQS